MKALKIMSNDIKNKNEEIAGFFKDREKIINYYLETKDYSGLIPFCKELINNSDNGKSPSIEPFKVVLLGYIAIAYREIGDYDNSIKYYYEELKIDPIDPYIYSGLALAYKLKGYSELELTCLMISNSLEENNKKISFKNTFPLAVMFCNLYVHTKNELFYSISIDYYLNIIKLQPKNHKIYLYLSSTYEEKKDYKDAIRTIVKAIALKPNNKDYIYQLGNLYYKSEKYKLAIKMFEKYQKLYKKSNKFIDYILSKAYFMKNDYKSAIDLIDKSVIASPESAEFYELLGDLYSKTCLIDKSIENYKKAISIEPLCCKYLFKLADLYYNLEEYEKSLEFYEKMDEVDPPEELKDELKNVILEIKLKIKNIN